MRSLENLKVMLIYVATRLGHGIPRYLVKQYAGVSVSPNETNLN